MFIAQPHQCVGITSFSTQQTSVIAAVSSTSRPTNAASLQQAMQQAQRSAAVAQQAFQSQPAANKTKENNRSFWVTCYDAIAPLYDYTWMSYLIQRQDSGQLLCSVSFAHDKLGVAATADMMLLLDRSCAFAVAASRQSKVLAHGDHVSRTDEQSTSRASAAHVPRLCQTAQTHVTSRRAYFDLDEHHRPRLCS